VEESNWCEIQDEKEVHYLYSQKVEGEGAPFTSVPGKKPACPIKGERRRATFIRYRKGKGGGTYLQSRKGGRARARHSPSMRGGERKNLPSPFGLGGKERSISYLPSIEKRGVSRGVDKRYSSSLSEKGKKDKSSNSLQKEREEGKIL